MAEYCRYGLRLDLRGAGEERVRKVLALRGLCVAVELMGGTSRLGSRDPGPAGSSAGRIGVQEKQDDIEWGLVVSASKPSVSRDDRGDQVKEQGKLE